MLQEHGTPGQRPRQNLVKDPRKGCAGCSGWSGSASKRLRILTRISHRAAQQGKGWMYRIFDPLLN
eukprot:8504054-Prorocentrum_lima.AAC.1